jgi:hypothetical protein
VSSGWSLDGLATTLAADQPLPWISDDQMRARLGGSAAYTMVVLLPTDTLVRPQVDPIIWAHGRRNIALIASGVAPIITPVTASGGPCGFAIFRTDPDETRTLMDQDPGVCAGIFTYEIHTVRGFPGSTLP